MPGTMAMDPSAAGQLAHGVRLSCEQCTQRKKRCDKSNPCSNCQRHGAICKPVVRPRLPRGKGVTKDRASTDTSDGDLRARVARLEQLLQLREQQDSSAYLGGSLSQGLESSNPSATSAVTEDAFAASKHGHRTDNHYIRGSSGNEALRQINICSGSPFIPELHAHSSGPLSPAEFNEMTPDHANSLLPIQLQRNLAELFLSRIDSVFKVIHQPSLRAYLLEGKQYLDYEHGHHAPKTLASAIYYAATCILSEQECYSIFQRPKSSVVASYRRVCDAALFHADFTTTNDLTVLQAFIISLLSYRLLDKGRRVWTMLSMALRVGQALSLHIVNPPFPIRPLEMELRRRVWHAIGILDAQSSLDRATEPMVLPAWLEHNAPSNINDEDVSFFSDKGPPERAEFTDMTFTLLISQAHKIMRSLNFSRWTQHGIMDMEDRQSLVIEFQKSAVQLVSGCSPDKSPLQWLTVRTAEYLTASLQLVALRPLQRDPSFTPPQVKNHGLLKLCVDILQRAQELSEDARVAPWSWFKELWVPWHPLSVAIAELCSCDDVSVMETHWPVVEHSFHIVGHVVADSKDGILWRPIDKLMKQAESKRASLRPTTAKQPQQQQLGIGSQISQSQDAPLGATPTIQNSAHKTVPPVENEQSSQDPNRSKDIWDILDIGDWTGHLGQSSWSNFTSFLDELHEADDSILTFG